MTTSWARLLVTDHAWIVPALAAVPATQGDVLRELAANDDKSIQLALIRARRHTRSLATVAAVLTASSHALLTASSHALLTASSHAVVAPGLARAAVDRPRASWVARP